jgi:GLPGLI family protein
MKTKFLEMAVCLLVVFTWPANAQLMVVEGGKIPVDTVGQVQLTLQYEAKFVTDTLKKEDVTNETMLLEIGKGISKFYSYTKYFCDSILRADVAKGAPQETFQEHYKQYGKSKWSETSFKGYPVGKVTTLDEVAGINRLRCEETEERPVWKLEEDTANILSYTCRKAVCEFKGRKWTAWFAPEIPISEGPWKLCGLPGLILKAEDEQKHYSFVCVGLKQNRTNKAILFQGKKYEPVDRKAYNKLHERYFADPIGFITSNNPNVKVIVKDSHGNPTKGPRNVPYNPIEWEDKK